MGNTIRRQPVNFNIPNSPNYKFLNITDFKGLNITDNPFIGDPETASDLLNVYVDEQNTLTTRPRLQEKFDLKESAIIPEEATIISMTYIDNKYLVQYKYEDEVCIFWLIPTEDGYEYQRIEINKSDKCSPIGESKIQIAKYKNYYVFVDGVSYKIIDENNVVCNASEKAYVPLTKINKSFSNALQETPLESPNILTGSYKESYGSTEKDFKGLDFTQFVGLSNVTLIDKRGTKKTIARVEKEDYLKYVPLEAVETTNSSDVLASDNTLTTIIKSKMGTKRYDISYDSGNTFTSNFVDYTIFSIGVSGDGQTIILLHDITSSGIKYSISTDGGRQFTYKTSGDDSSSVVVYGAVDVSYDGTKIIVCGLQGAWYSDDNGSTMKKIPEFAPSLDTYINEVFCFVSDDGKHGLVYGPSVVAGYDGAVAVYKNNSWISITNALLPQNVTLDNVVAMGIDSDNGDLYLFTLDWGGFVLKGTTINKTSWTVISNTDGVLTDRTAKPIIIHNKTGVQAKTDIRGGYVVFPNLDFSYNTKLRFNLTDTDTTGGTIIELSCDGRNVVAVKNTKMYTTYSYPEGIDFLIVERTAQENPNQSELNKLNQSTFLKEFNNFLWLGGNKNFIIHSAVTDEEKLNNVLYMPVKNKNYLGNDDNEITGFNISSDYDLVTYTKNNLWLISRQEILDGVYDYIYTETRSDNGHIAKGQTIVTPLNEYPLQLNNKGFFVYQPIQNVLTSDKSSVLVSNNINAKLLKIEHLKNAYFVNHLYWTLMFVPNEAKTQVFVLDDRDASWYYWEFNEKLVSAINIDDEIELTNEDGRHFTLETKDIINEFNPEVTEYYDDGKKLIEWFWKSQVLHLGTMNYSKKLVDTTFIVADTEMSDEYGLNYAYTAYRKMLSETQPTTITSKLNYVQSTTKRTMIPRFNFIQLKLSNVDDDYNNNKLRLIGLGLKYVLLEGLLR